MFLYATVMIVRRSSGLSPFVIIVAVIFLVIPFHLRPENFIVDDGYFYPQIARFLVNGQGSTFNGIMLTNGYHPLWMLFCVVGAEITQRSSALLQILSVVQDLMLLASVLLLVALTRAAKLRGVWLGCLFVLFFNSVLGIWRMLESPLALLLQIITLLLAVPGVLPGLKERLGRWQLPLLGICLGLVMLARLDLLFFAGTILFYQMLRQDSGHLPFATKLWQVILPGAIASLMMTPYLIWNWQTFHHLLPISGAIKSTFPHVQAWGFPSFTYPTLIGIAINGALLFRRTRTPFQTLCLLSAISAALHLAYTLSFGGLAPWYLTTGALAFALATTRVVSAALARTTLGWIPETAAAILLVVLMFSAALLRSTTNLSFSRIRTGHASLSGNYAEPKRALAERLDATLPSGTRLYFFDAPGGVAYYSHMSVLPVDGLVSDYAYNRELVQLGVSAYAAKHNIQYIVAPVVTSQNAYNRLDLQATRLSNIERVAISAPLRHIPAGSLDLPDSQLLFTFPQINPDLEALFPLIGVWRIQP